MSLNLLIRDGEPHWWNSPDIWVVPGNDPNGPPGQPVAGEPAFIWGRIKNDGEQAGFAVTILSVATARNLTTSLFMTGNLRK